MTIDAQQSLAIRVNGEPRRVPAGVSIAQMLAELGLDPRRMAVERNLEVVPRATLADVPVADGDAFEVVHFVGGG
jgi:thiamine biosynthesis protein ThiS